MPAFSSAASGMRSSEIRKLMKLAADPAVISFAGGMPNNSLFPVDLAESLYHSLPAAKKQAAFQYGPTAGLPPLRESLSDYLRGRGLPVDDNELIITTGAQQAINLLAKVFIDPGDTVITEDPSFIGALAAFKSYQASLIGVEMDNDGIELDRLSAVLDGEGKNAKLLYLSPYFHNPAGIIYSEKRKRRLVELIRGRDICLLEDDPYSELYFEPAGKQLAVPMKATDDNALPICYVGTFAKIFGPGMRLGWLLGPRDIVEKCEMAKQSMDACSPSFTQILADAYLREGKLGPYLEKLRPIYARRAHTMLEALDAHMPEGVSWTKPKGGFYVWVTLPEHMNATDIFNSSLEKGAAFVIGSAFDPRGVRNNSFRLAFSHTPEERIAEGVEIICRAVAQNR